MCMVNSTGATMLNALADLFVSQCSVHSHALKSPKAGSGYMVALCGSHSSGVRLTIVTLAAPIVTLAAKKKQQVGDTMGW